MLHVSAVGSTEQAPHVPAVQFWIPIEQMPGCVHERVAPEVQAQPSSTMPLQFSSSVPSQASMPPGCEIIDVSLQSIVATVDGTRAVVPNGQPSGREPSMQRLAGVVPLSA
jgi:hypothetical protein